MCPPYTLRAMDKLGGAVQRQSFTTRMAARILAISPDRIRYWVKRRLVKPSASHGRHYQFSFEDLLMMRLTKELLPSRRRLLPIRRCFERLSGMLPGDRPMTALRLYQEDGRILVRDGASRFEAETGQFVLAFSEQDYGESVRHADAPARLRRLLAAAAEMEESNPLRALRLYHEYLEHEPDDSDIHRRLSRLFELNGDLQGAIRHLDAAAVLEPASAEIPFDLGVLYRKQQDFDRAAACFSQALERDPSLIEAHLHLSQIYEEQGRERDSFRHLSAAYRLMHKS